MSTDQQLEKIKVFREALESGETFILPEAWDVASARVLGELKFPVIGTSAASIAWVNGYSTKEYIKLEDLLMVAARIARRSTYPVNADLVGGLTFSIEQMHRGIQAAIAVGCSGIMLSDASRNGKSNIMPVETMVEHIKVARKAADNASIPLVITACTDTFLHEEKGHSPLQDVSERAVAYYAAGADCIHVSGIQHIHIVENVARNIPGPASIRISIATKTNMKAYKESGIACVNVGSSLLRSLLGNLRLKADELLTFGQFDHLDRAVTPDELEKLVTYRPSQAAKSAEAEKSPEDEKVTEKVSEKPPEKAAKSEEVVQSENSDESGRSDEPEELLLEKTVPLEDTSHKSVSI
ncbi:MAG: isocitrate lyase/phosphoenolpyruvate mutase family protein [Pseudomonadota bacterium]